MIIDSIIKAILSFLQVMLDGLPSLPSVPSQLSITADWIVNSITSVAFYFRYIFGEFWPIIITLAILFFSFEKAYWVFMWLLKKIPGVNIK